jgi:hypothetical protein
VTYVEEFKDVIRCRHSAEADHVDSVPIKEAVMGQTVWEGIVEVFELHNHPTASRLYAWAHETNDLDKQVRHVTVLHFGPVNSPLKAVRAAILRDKESGAA